MRILIADDEDNLRNLYKQILEAENYIVDTAENGEVALPMLLDGGYDLVLLDVRMPKMDGLSTVKNLKQATPKKLNGPIYFLTNDEDDITIAKSISLDIQGYLIKSQYTPDKLVVEVKRILTNEKEKNIQ